MGTKYGYMRVSTKDQNEQRQLLALRQFGIPDNRIRADKLSGKDFARPAYQKLVHEELKHGDLLVVQSIDRLGRNYKEILEEWRFITKTLQADIKILDMPLLDTRPERDLVGTLISDIVLQLLSFVAENERESIHRRQAEGIAAAKARGVHMGRPAGTLPKNFSLVYRKWKNKELTIKQVQAQYALSRATFYRLVQKLESDTAAMQKVLMKMQ